jgi:two-component system, LytTR family, sensor kinase
MHPLRKTGNIIFNIALHALGWLILFLINFFFLNNYQVKFDFLFHARIWIIYILVFYANYYFLIPRLLFKRKFAVYIIVTLLLISGASVLKNYYDSDFSQRSRPPAIEMHGTQFSEGISKPLTGPPGEPGPLIPRMMLFSFYGLLLIYTASTLIRFVQKWIDDDRLNTETEREKISAELSYLKQQVNPHFLFNALNNIYSLTIDCSVPASEAILKLSSILRYMLYETEKKMVMLKDELDVIKNYMELQKMRLTDKVRIKYTVEGNPGSFKIAPLLIIPLIENAFKYGSDNTNDSFIEITIWIVGDTIDLNINNKIAMRPPTEPEDSGIGIKNLMRRLELLYPGKHSFENTEANGVFTVHMQIVLNP